jgi:hypothetical protein
MGIDFLCLDNKGNQYGTYPFKKDKYDVIYNRYNDKVKDAFTYVFDEVNANKLINMGDDNIEDLKHDYSYIAVVALENGEDVFAKMLPKNMNDFESNDKPKLEYLGYKVAIISNKWNEYCYIISWN